MFYLGIDLGSSSVKLALIDKSTSQQLRVVKEPQEEMPMISTEKGWAEQNPEDWWQNVCIGLANLQKQHPEEFSQLEGIGISYQMHGLVLIDAQGEVLRNAIIWCDSRAVPIGEQAYQEMGENWCDTHLMNSPANFTAAKLAWVKKNEPELFSRIYKFMLPGDYIAYKLSGKPTTTISGLSEGVFWDFSQNEISQEVLNHFGFDKTIVPEVHPSFALHGVVSAEGASVTHIKEGTPLLYRAGDQPNNAMSLNVFNPGEIAATGGTSGVIYAVTDNPQSKETSRVNNFAHINHSSENPRIGKLLCINGSGVLYRWLRNNLDVESYDHMNALVKDIPVGSEGLSIIPFGNGAERILNNENIGASIKGIDLNRHTKAHLCRAALEGIAFSFVYGFEIMMSDGVQASVIRAGNDNLFRSSIFCETIATLLGVDIEIFDTTGAIGAARAALITQDSSIDFSQFIKHDYEATVIPMDNFKDYQEAYNVWKNELHIILKSK